MASSGHEDGKNAARVEADAGQSPGCTVSEMSARSPFGRLHWRGVAGPAVKDDLLSEERGDAVKDDVGERGSEACRSMSDVRKGTEADNGTD